MTAILAQTALAFAREVMGWDRPVDRKYAEQNRDPFGKPCKAWSPYVFDFYGKHGHFQHTDLAAVLNAVRTWCDTNDGAVELSYYGYVPGEWEAPVPTSVSLEAMVHTDPCQALLTACLEASRKLKAA